MRNEKQCQILDCAFKIFSRFGLKKTSIDDIAKAADISRQGVYLHFKNKDEIFKASVEKYLEDRYAATLAALQNERPIDERLLGSLQEWFGKSIGMIHQDARDVLKEGADVAMPLFERYTKDYKTAMAKALQKEYAADKRLADDVTEILHACGLTWKHELKSQEDFAKRVKSAIRITLLAIRV